MSTVRCQLTSYWSGDFPHAIRNLKCKKKATDFVNFSGVWETGGVDTNTF